MSLQGWVQTVILSAP